MFSECNTNGLTWCWF